MNEKVQAGKPLTTQPSLSLAELKRLYSDEDSCKALLRDMRWPDGVRCPRCNHALGDRVYNLSRKFHWVCKNIECGGRNGYRFSVITKTVFENTNYPLSTWFEVIYLMTQSRKGISALQIHRQIKSGDYRTAWYMVMRVRAAMKDPELKKLLGDVIEVDEMYHGGKAENMHRSKRRRLALVGAKGKVAVIGAIARKGNVVCRMVENTDTPVLDSFVRRVVDKDKVELVATDEHSGYRLLKYGYPHEVVKHSAGEYVRGIVHTNTIEGFWSLFKRGVMGSFHHVSKAYLPLYLAEFQFRYNNRKDPDIFYKVLAGC